MVNAHSKLSLREGAMLLMEFHGSPDRRERTGARPCRTLPPSSVVQRSSGPNTPEERTRLWTARHNAYFAGIQSRPGCKAITTDTCVPISQPRRRAARTA